MVVLFAVAGGGDFSLQFPSKLPMIQEDDASTRVRRPARWAAGLRREERKRKKRNEKMLKTVEVE